MIFASDFLMSFLNQQEISFNELVKYLLVCAKIIFMLVKCPKCHFEQLKDNYCANCGIEMDNYKPEKTPFLKIVFKSPLFQLIIFLGVVYSGYREFILKQKNTTGLRATQIEDSELHAEPISISNSTHQDIQMTVSKTQSNENLSNKEATPTITNTNSENKISNNIDNSNAFENEDVVEAQTEQQNNFSSQGLNSVQSVIKVLPKNFHIKYFEVNKSIINNLKTITSATEHNLGDFSLFKILKSEKSYKTDNWKVLEQGSREIKDIKSNKNNHWFVGARNPINGSVAGLNISLTINQSESIKNETGEEYAFTLDIQKELPDSFDNGSGENSTLNYNFTAAKGDILLIEGAFPRKKIPTENKDFLWMNNSISQIFFSDQFSNNINDFIISVEFQ